MTRNLVARFDDVYDEITCACEEVFTEWVSVPVFDAVIHIVARTGNRLFVGLPLCMNFLGCYVFYSTINPGRHPELRQRIVDLRRRHMRHPGKDELTKTVMERVLLDREFGTDRPDRPNDTISWFYDVASVRYSAEAIVDEIVQRIMFLNFSAIHTSTHALTNVLYHLAEHPEIYLQSLRNEVEGVTEKLGWTKAALRDMVKVDSFVRESERFNGLSSLIMTRKVVNPSGFTFSNGVHLPMDSIVSVANYSTHHDDTYYPDANTFDGFRFSRVREASEGFDAIRHQFVHTTPEYVTFGHGRHSCPGERSLFFAANELKVALAHIVMYYDVKLGDDCNGVKPDNSWMSIALIPDKLIYRSEREWIHFEI
ncbi:cytochrome P450 [Gymnopilus junonius]|uniref:Cytochrome P450 n=1 Tax=Gymnopilus junonius TaxID=109634 RepID=A0A9P5NP99_GYMJU|nr:cytochrome P450 [Gymnopilus junonius]